jgi:biopolymer transport protein ExbD
MSFLPEHADDEMMNDINMTPLIDVMLVLLIVFILAMPVIQSAIPLNLPKASSAATQQHAEPVRLDLDAQGQAYWNGKAVTDEVLTTLAQQVAKQEPQPVIRLRGDRVVPYERMLQTLSSLQAAGLSKVNFMAQNP